MIPQSESSNSKERKRPRLARFRRRAKHRAEAEETRKWRRRALGLGLLGLMLVAGVALAFLFSRKDSAPDSFTAAAIGEVRIGDLETIGFFDELPPFQPGDSHIGCGIVHVDATEATDIGDFRVYTAAVAGDGLEDLLRVRMERRGPPSGTFGPPGRVDSCTGSDFTQLFNGTIAELAELADYDDGRLFPAPEPGDLDEYVIRLTVSLPEEATDVSGQTASIGFAFENR